MQAAPTSRFARAVEASHTIAVAAEILVGGNPALQLPPIILDGAITQERAIVRTSASLEIADPKGVLDTATAADITELLVPAGGHELRLWRGVQLPDEPDPQLVPMGTLVITDTRGAWPRLQVEARDRLWLVTDKRGRFRNHTQVAKNTNCADAITDILAGTATTALPAHVPVDIPPTPETTPLLTFDAQASRGEEAARLAQALGRILYADRLGTVTTMQEPDLDTAPAVVRLVEWDEGEQALGLGGAVLLAATPGTSAEDAVNVMVVDSEATGETSWHGEAADTDPGSPTYTGIFGESIEFLSSPLMTSQAMVNQASRTGLANRIGLGASLEAEVVCNPLLDPVDVAYTRHAAALVDGRWMVDRITSQLRSGRAQLTMRNIRTVLPS